MAIEISVIIIIKSNQTTPACHIYNYNNKECSGTVCFSSGCYLINKILRKTQEVERDQQEAILRII